MATFGALALYRWIDSGMLFFGLLSLRDGLACYYFNSETGARSTIVLGSVASILSFDCTSVILFFSKPKCIYGGGFVLNFLSITGFLLATLATIELGDRFGVSPAARGQRCQTGVYKWLGHPMYTGYMMRAGLCTG